MGDAIHFKNEQPMQIVADNLHVIHPTIANAVKNLDPEPIQSWARRCLKAGAQAIDINSGPLPSQPKERFAFLVKTVQEICPLPLVLDTTNPEALDAGLAVRKGPSVINGFSMEQHKLDHILPLATKYDVDIIGYLLDSKSQVPTEPDEMMALAVELFDACTAAGVPPQRLIIDPIVAPLSWQNGVRHNQSVLSVIRSLPDLLGAPVRTIAGLSNLVSGPQSMDYKIALQNAFLPMLAAAGLDLVLMNVLHAPVVQTARACTALLGDKILSWEQIAGS
jgi:5-methyltetrahydrofolate corrinoid/iron sulfur protein methyltransferase